VYICTPLVLSCIHIVLCSSHYMPKMTIKLFTKITNSPVISYKKQRSRFEISRFFNNFTVILGIWFFAIDFLYFQHNEPISEIQISTFAVWPLYFFHIYFDLILLCYFNLVLTNILGFTLCRN
jgi:hypothetical protein